MTRVAILARSPILRAGMVALVTEDPALQLVASPSEADVILDTAADYAPPDPQDPPLVLISEAAGGDFTSRALRAGIRAVLPPDATPEEIRAALRAAAAGLVVLRPADVELAPPSPALEETALSPRELEILRLLAEGMANKTIAWKLGISEHTVKFHVASILSRLHAATRTEAVTIGVRRGLIML